MQAGILRIERIATGCLFTEQPLCILGSTAHDVLAERLPLAWLDGHAVLVLVIDSRASGP